MRERHGLDATAKQYKDRIKIWGLNKNIRADEMESMIKIQQKRELEKKRTAFRVRKRPVNLEKIKRYMRDYPTLAFGANKDENMDGNMDGNIDATATPGAVSYYTPSETGPLTPQEAPSPYVTANPESSCSYQNPQGYSYELDVLDPTLPLKTLKVADRAEAKDSARSEQTQGTDKSRPLSLPEQSGE